MPEGIAGVPLHPLVVHAVVVLLPLAAVGVIVEAVVPRWRSALAVTVLMVTIVGTALVPIATQSGKNLRQSLGVESLVARHASLGQSLIFFAGPLLVAAVGLWWTERRDGDREYSASAISITFRIVAVIIAVATIIQVVRIGHSGAEAVWSGVVPPG